MGKNFKKNVGAWLNKSGASFRVWAPFASSVALVGSFNNWSEAAMTSENDGYWSIYFKGAKAGQEYKFVIRNGDRVFYRNDPRALHFPTTSGTSVIASSNFDWEGEAFTPPAINQQVIYELHVGTFNRPDPAITGTFSDVEDKLDYLKELGINMIELMPISTMLMDRGWGYAIDYIYSVESLYGGRRGFMEFVKAAHRRGIGVILDVVYNHFGPDTNLDLWQFDGWSQDNYGGIYFYNDWRAETPWGNTRPDFGRREVKQYILDNVRMWLHDCHVDGLRVDSTIYIRNVKGHNNDPGNDLPDGWNLLQDINSLVRKIKPSAITVAEDIAANEYLVKDTGAGGAGFSAQWELGWPAALRSALSSTDPSQINLNDVCNQLTRSYNNNPLDRVNFIDSHDSASNGSARLNELIAGGQSDSLFARRQQLIAACLVLTSPGIPMLFQGQEFMTSGSFNDWEGLDWQKADRFKGITEAFKHLISLRLNQGGVSAGLAGPNINLFKVDNDNKVVAYHRWQSGGPKDDVVAIVNFSGRSIKGYSLNWPRDGLWQVRFNSTWSGYSSDFKNTNVKEVAVTNKLGSLDLPPDCALVLSQDS